MIFFYFYKEWKIK